MNKQTLFVTLTTAALMCGCQSSKVKISGRFVGGDAKNIYLEQVLPLTQSVVDSAALAPDGSYRMELTGVAKTPSLYNVIYDGERIPLLLAGVKKADIQKRVDALLDVVGMAHRKAEYPRTLSGGEQQRVAFARAIANEPDIILQSP